MVELSPGDFLYQSDQELFLVVMGENEESYKFAVHGWRDIDKERLDEYIEDSRSKVHKQDTFEDEVDDDEKLNKLKQLFKVYEKAELPESGPPEDFALDET